PAVPPGIRVRFMPVGEDSGVPVSFTALGTAPPTSPSATARGPGICVFDINGDGLPDVLLAKSDKALGHVALFLNRGKGKFEDATKGSGLQDLTDAISCAVGDYDNDGKPDIALSTSRGLLLFHNDGNGKFSDRTKE